MKQKIQISASSRNHLVKYTLWLIVIWTLLLATLLTVDLKLLNNATQNLALREAEAHYQKDEAFRFWSAIHGGFYVIADDRTIPNPYLEHIPERDIETSTGVKLTLMNPAYALRQMFKEYEETYGVSGHITSLKPLRPENTPDDWERLALESFEKGETKFYEFTKFKGERYLRYMEPLITQQGCLKCHKHQDYVLGDIRGGVSVSVPMASYLAEESKAASVHIISFTVLWLLGFTGVILSYRVIKRNREERELAQRLLQESHNQLEIKVKERTGELQIEIAKHKEDEGILKISEERYKGIIDSTASCIAVFEPTEDGLDFIFIDFNPMAEKLENISKKEVLGRKVTEVFPGIEEFGLLKVFRDVLKSGSAQYHPISFYTDDKIQGYRDNHVYKLSTGEIVSVYQDVTEQVMAKKELQIERDKLISIFESMVDGIYIINKDYDIEYINSALRQQFGSRDGKKCYEYFHDSSEPCTFCKNKDVFAGKTVQWEWTSPVNNKTYDLIDTPMYNADGSISKLEIFRDITFRKHAEKEITQLSTAVTQSPSVIAITNLKGDLEYVNPKFTELTGYSLEECKGVNPRILKSGEQPDEVYEELWNTISDGREWYGEFHNKKKNGEFFWEEATVAPIFNKHGEVTNYLKVAIDITERKRAEQIQNVLFQIANAVTSSNTLEELISQIQDVLGTIIDTSNFYIALYDPETDMLSLPYYADEKDKFTSAPAAKTLSKYVIDTKKPLLADIKLKEKLFAEGKLEYQGSLSKVWLGVPLKIEEKVIGVFALQSYTDENAFSLSDMDMLEFVSHQISISIARKKIEEDLLIALDKATESDRLKSTFLATISHELRTPLNAVIGFSDLINNDWSMEEIIGFAKTINESGTHLLSIVEEIFDITLIESGETSINNKEENLHQVLIDINKVVESEQLKLNKNYLKLGLIIPESDKDLIVNIDSAKLKQILINLLKNAIKFTHQGHIKYGYSLIDDNDKKMLRFYVEDTGIGIPPDMQEVIFATFRQVEESLSRTYGGTGIGLSISKKLTELLEGKIWVESTEGVGSTFYFTIPYVGAQISSKSETVSKKEKDTTPKENTFLIVEDDETSFEFLQIVLEKPGTKIIWALNGKEAVQFCKEMPEINLVLMDINMQIMDGYAATKQIKKLCPHLPIIAQTAYAIAGDREKALRAGCDDYISKPIVIEDLMNKIKKLIKY